MGQPRARRRYIAFQAQSGMQYTKQDIFDAVNKFVSVLREKHGITQPYFRLLEYDQQSGRGILMCTHAMIEPLRSSLNSIDNIANEKAKVTVLGVSGTIKRLRLKYLPETIHRNVNSRVKLKSNRL